MLRANFYSQVSLGHATILSLFSSVHRYRPDYMAPFLAWEPVDARQIVERFPEISDQKRYRRAHSMYLALLLEAGYPGGSALRVDLELNERIRQRLAHLEGIRHAADLETNSDGKSQVCSVQRLPIAALIYRQLWTIYEQESEGAGLFPVSENSGKPYFEAIHQCLLRMLGDTGVSDAKKLTPFLAYHDPAGRDLINEIVSDVAEGKTVLLDLSSANETVAQYYSEMVARAVLDHQMRRFAELDPVEFEKTSVLFYFEEAHHLFRADDKDLSSIYNRLAKEGGKFRVGMVYATQSLTTLSPDLLKMTENLFIAHVNDDREVREIERRYEFKDIGRDIQRCRTKGFVRMITQSHRYVLPVQIVRFQLPLGAEHAPASRSGRTVRDEL